MPLPFVGDSEHTLFSTPCLVVARASPLSQAQFWEFMEIMRSLPERIIWQPIWIESRGDKDKQKSLWNMGKSDFFTYELDQLLLHRKARVALHSAKDLPEPLPNGLVVAAITAGIESCDVLVLRHGLTVKTLPDKAWIGCSCARREEMVRRLRIDFRIKEIRGTIHERLAQLESGAFDGVVMAKAALIRLRLLDHINWIALEGNAAPYQGQLALVIRQEDQAINYLGQIDSRKNR